MKTKNIGFLLLFGMIISSFYPIMNSNNKFLLNTTQNSDLLNENFNNPDTITNLQDFPEDIRSAVEGLLEEQDPTYDNDIDIGNALADRDNTYSTIYEPWKSKAAIHALAFHEETGYLALAGGYLYDNEVHIYRLNTETEKFDKVWDSGDQIIQSDVMCLDFGDTDLNDFLEIVAGSSDGHVYVFEQRHIYDPYTNTENMFDLVWTSPSMFRVFDVKIDDVDRDYRPDIIVGTWEGLYLYEYQDHSGYPFVAEHWIDYKLTWSANEKFDQQIYSVESGDTNRNGLPEVVIGTRDGTIYIYENGGTTIWIEDDESGEEYPFPLIRDDHYDLIWTSENYTWTPIISMAIGEIDGDNDNTKELAIVAQGQGLFTLEWNSDTQTYDYKKVFKDFEDWETFGPWGLDEYADSVVSANNVTFYNGSITVDEPINYVYNDVQKYFDPLTACQPYNTGMANASDGHYTKFSAIDPSVDNATAIIDFGKDEEGTGSANNKADILIRFNETLSSDSVRAEINISISQEGSDFEQISPDTYKFVGNILEIDADDALMTRHWDWFRYLKISVYNDAEYQIDSIELQNLYNLLTDALSVTIGPMRLDGSLYGTGNSELDKMIVGTVTGKYIVTSHNTDTPGNYYHEIAWDSGEDERFTLGAGIWDMEYLPLGTDVPIWRNLDYMNPDFVGPTFVLSGGRHPISWSYGNFYPAGTYIDDYNYLVGTEDGTVQALTPFGDYDTTTSALIAMIPDHYTDNFREDMSFAPEFAPATLSPDIPILQLFHFVHLHQYHLHRYLSHYKDYFESNQIRD